MDSYTFALALGGAGLVAMAATGLAHSGSHEGAGGHDSGGHGHLPHGDSVMHTGHAAGTHLPAHAAAHHAGGLKSTLLSLASPRVLFSLLVGFGLTGVVARPLLSGVVLLFVALLGAVVFERALVAPLWRFLFRFASNPATTLEGSLLSEALAASGFDDNGQGLVAVEVDGQIVQCLGTLRDDDRALGVRVRAGDVLRVEQVDAARSRCTVSYVGHGVR
jgi:translation initiation factor IF-1